MKTEVLVVTMGKKNFSLVDEMNIESDAVIANQDGRMDHEERFYPFGKVSMVTTDTKGVGANRNISIHYSSADFLLFADDDMRYVDGYGKIVEDAFNETPSADAIIFNVDSNVECRNRRVHKGVKRIHWWKAFNYGAVRIAVRRNSLLRENIMFNLNYGGGTLFSAGEDTFLIADMLRKGLKLYSSPKTIAVLDDTPGTSTWFHGFDKKYYYDQGIITKGIHRWLPHLMSLKFLMLHPNYKKSGLTFRDAWHQMMRGLKGYKDMIPYRSE